MTYSTEENTSGPSAGAMRILPEQAVARSAETQLQRMTELLRHEYNKACQWLHICYGQGESRRDFSIGGVGGQSRFGTPKVDQWTKLATKCIRHDVSPRALISAAFSGRTRIPAPKELMAFVDPDKLRRHQRQVAEELVQALSYQQQLFDRVIHRDYPDDWSVTDIWRATLGDPTLDLSALFRYATARLGGFLDIVLYYEAHARAQFEAEEPAYREAWPREMWAPFVSDLSAEAQEGHE